MAVGLNQVCGELNGFYCRAADHDPERKVYFQRESHRASPLFDLRGLEATNAPQGTKVPTGDLGQFKVVRCTGTLFHSLR
jgi:hypothetical protein